MFFLFPLDFSDLSSPPNFIFYLSKQNNQENETKHKTNPTQSYRKTYIRTWN